MVMGILDKVKESQKNSWEKGKKMREGAKTDWKEAKEEYKDGMAETKQEWSESKEQLKKEIKEVKESKKGSGGKDKTMTWVKLMYLIPFFIFGGAIVAFILYILFGLIFS
jgi:hypothetical protein